MCAGTVTKRGWRSTTPPVGQEQSLTSTCRIVPAPTPVAVDKVRSSSGADPRRAPGTLCSFRQKICKITPTWELPPTSGKSWISHFDRGIHFFPRWWRKPHWIGVGCDQPIICPNFPKNWWKWRKFCITWLAWLCWTGLTKFSSNIQSWLSRHFCDTAIENKSDTEIDQLNFNLKHYEKCKFSLKPIRLLTVSNLFPLDIAQKCQSCQLRSWRENSKVKILPCHKYEEGIADPGRGGCMIQNNLDFMPYFLDILTKMCVDPWGKLLEYLLFPCIFS